LCAGRGYVESSGRDQSWGRSEQDHGESWRGYGRGYNESTRGSRESTRGSRESSRASSESLRGASESSQRYNYPTSQRSSQQYGERGGSYDYDRGSYGGNEDRGWWDRAADAVASWFGDEDAERRRRQDEQRQNRGRGPKNYRRSDERIKEDINERMAYDYSLDASEIEVTVTNAEVLLLGTVTNRHDKRRAEDIAEAVAGVNNVENRLRVKRGGSQSTYNQSSGSTRTSTGASMGAAAASTAADSTAADPTAASMGAAATGSSISGTGSSISGGSASGTGSTSTGETDTTKTNRPKSSGS
jgi:osmotically-inducible protein OsmY